MILKKKIKFIKKYLSYLGNKNNPPDFIIRHSSAVEVKKIENLSFGDIALNSSYPKDYLYSNSTLITQKCRNCEDEFGSWIKKDMIYAIGNVVKDKLKMLWLLDGACYCADQSLYSSVKNIIHNGIEDIVGMEFKETKELGKINKIDELGITNLRIRGMWSIQHPMKVFSSIIGEYDKNTNLQIYCLILKEKYDILPDEDKEVLLEYVNNQTLLIENVKIKNPNNTNDFLDAVLLKAQL